MKIIIVGNGSIGLALAAGLQKKQPSADITIVGPKSRPFSASLAAAAMLNSFAELEPGSLDLDRDRIKFETCQKAAHMWKDFLSEQDVPAHFLRLGTIILNNTAADKLDDENFNAIHTYLEEYNEPYELIDPTGVKGYQPADHVRAKQALFVPREGWLNPDGVLMALDKSLRAKGIKFIDASVRSMNIVGDKTQGLILSNDESLSADVVIMAAGSYVSELFNNADGQSQAMIQVLHGVGCTIGLESESIECDYVIRTPNRGGACGVYHAPYNKNTFVCGASNLITTAPEKNARITSIYNLTASAMEQVNTDHEKSQLIKINLGYRPTTIDTYPAIGWLNENTYTVTGTKRDGYLFAPWLSTACAAHILDKDIHDRYLNFCDPYRKAYTFGTADECATKYAKHKISGVSQHGYRGGHTTTTMDLLDYYKNKVLAFLASNNIQHGIATEIIEPLLAGHISIKAFQ